MALPVSRRRRATPPPPNCLPPPAVAPSPPNCLSRPAPPNPCQDHVAEPPSARTQPQPSVSYLSILLGTTTLKDTATSSSSPQAVAETPPPKPTIYVKDPPDWYFSIYIRIDRSGSFHTYPHLGGPFKSLQDVEKAIERYLDDKRHKTLWNEQAGDSGMDIIIKRTNLAGGRALGTARERPAPV
ncbi:extensin [Triticum aestivum]|uniref:extensin n=1 Tax=Triticum aestivum TaxID=4565 RepID=UPI001D016327|nr:extensin-like [Triticum aestivum]